MQDLGRVVRRGPSRSFPGPGNPHPGSDQAAWDQRPAVAKLGPHHLTTPSWRRSRGPQQANSFSTPRA